MDRIPKYTLKEKKDSRIPFVSVYYTSMDIYNIWYICKLYNCSAVICKKFLRPQKSVNSIFYRRLREVPSYFSPSSLLSSWNLLPRTFITLLFKGGKWLIGENLQPHFNFMSPLAISRLPLLHHQTSWVILHGLTSYSFSQPSEASFLSLFHWNCFCQHLQLSLSSYAQWLLLIF